MYKKPFIILIPPSEGKQAGGDGPALINVDESIREMIHRMHKLNKDQWSKVLGIKDIALLKAIEANNAVLTAPTMPAIERYTGVVYNAISYATLNPVAQQFFDKHVRIVSALWGLVSPKQAIPNYKWKIDKEGVAQYWHSIHSKKFTKVDVLNVLPKAYQKAFGDIIGSPVDFVIIKNKKRKPAGHQGKYIKGRFIRWVCEQQATSVKQWSLFNEDGFVWKDDCFIKEV